MMNPSSILALACLLSVSLALAAHSPPRGRAVQAAQDLLLRENLSPCSLSFCDCVVHTQGIGYARVCDCVDSTGPQIVKTRYRYQHTYDYFNLGLGGDTARDWANSSAICTTKQWQLAEPRTMQQTYDINCAKASQSGTGGNRVWIGVKNTMGGGRADPNAGWVYNSDGAPFAVAAQNWKSYGANDTEPTPITHLCVIEDDEGYAHHFADTCGNAFDFVCEEDITDNVINE